MFIVALGEVASAAAFEPMSAEEPAVVAAVLSVVAMPASAALVEGAALSVAEVPAADPVALVSAVVGCWAWVALDIGLAVSPMPGCALVVVAESAWFTPGSFMLD